MAPNIRPRIDLVTAFSPHPASCMVLHDNYFVYSGVAGCLVLWLEEKKGAASTNGSKPTAGVNKQSG